MTVRDSYDRRMLKTRCVCKPTCLNCGCWCHINWANIITSDRPCSSVLCPANGVRFSWFSLPSSLYFSQLFQRNIEIHLEPPWVLAPRKRVLPPVLPWPGDWALSQSGTRVETFGVHVAQVLSQDSMLVVSLAQVFVRILWVKWKNTFAHFVSACLETNYPLCRVLCRHSLKVFTSSNQPRKVPLSKPLSNPNVQLGLKWWTSSL